MRAGQVLYRFKELGWDNFKAHFGEGTVHLLCEMLNYHFYDDFTEYSPIFLRVVRGLGEIRNPEAIDALVGVIYSRHHEDIKQEASASLLKFSPQDFPLEVLEKLSELDTVARKFTTSEGGGYFVDPTVHHWVSIPFPGLVRMAEAELKRRRQ